MTFAIRVQASIEPLGEPQVAAADYYNFPLSDHPNVATGAIGLIEEGDTISIDIPNASITLEVSDAVLAERKAKYVAPEPNIKTGWLSRYARMVTSANLGAVLK